MTQVLLLLAAERQLVLVSVSGMQPLCSGKGRAGSSRRFFQSTAGLFIQPGSCTKCIDEMTLGWKELEKSDLSVPSDNCRLQSRSCHWKERVIGPRRLETATLRGSDAKLLALSGSGNHPST